MRKNMEPNYVNGRIGEKIKDLRNRNGLTQQELGGSCRTYEGLHFAAGTWPGGSFCSDTAGSDRMSGNYAL